MKKQPLVSVVALLGLLAPLATSAGEFNLDKDHSKVQFNISHLVISEVTGYFREYVADVEIKDGELVSASATLQVDSIDTDNEKRDNHLKSDDFFNAEEYPTITFESTKVTDDKLVGTLTIRGVTKEVALDKELKGPVTDPRGKVRYGLNLSGTIDRTEFGIDWNKTMEAGGLVVGKEVDITVSMEFVKQ